MRLISSRRPLRRCRTAPRGGLPPARSPRPGLRFSRFESRRTTKFHAAKRQTPPRRHPAGSPSGVFPRLQSLQPQRELHTSAKRNSASINKQTPRPGRTTTPRDGPAAHRTRARRPQTLPLRWSGYGGTAAPPPFPARAGESSKCPQGSHTPPGRGARRAAASACGAASGGRPAACAGSEAGACRPTRTGPHGCARRGPTAGAPREPPRSASVRGRGGSCAAPRAALAPSEGDAGGLRSPRHLSAAPKAKARGAAAQLEPGTRSSGWASGRSPGAAGGAAA